MLNLTAAQHFFASVPAEQSPRRKRGYQTLYYTRGLPEETIRAIEDRCIYTTAPGDPVKCQFYVLTDGSAAISRTVALAELDEFGRRGRYLAHTLVLDRSTFRQLDGCPLDVLEQAPFVTSLAGVLQPARAASDDLPALTLSITPRWRAAALEASRQWPPSGTVSLGRLAWQAPDLLEGRQPVFVVGALQEQLAALGFMFMLAAPQRRRLLSFDTHAAGCDWERRGWFWALGFAAAPSDARLVCDASHRQVQTSLSPVKDGPYAVWMVREGLATDPVNLIQGQVWAGALEQTLVDGAQPGKSLPPDAFLGRFAAYNGEAITRRWLAPLPQGLSAPLQQQLAAQAGQQAARLLSLLVAGVQPCDLQEFVYMALLDMRSSPSKQDETILGRWIGAADHRGMATLPPFWAGKAGAWAEALRALTLEDYEVLLDHLRGWPRPPTPLAAALLGPAPAGKRGVVETATAEDVARAQLWMRFAATAIPASEWPKAMATVADLGEPGFDLVTSYIDYFSRDAQAEIAGWLADYAGEATSLRTKLRIPPRQSLVSRFKFRK